MKYIIESRKFNRKVGESLFKVGDYVRQKVDKDRYIHEVKDSELRSYGRLYYIVPIDMRKGYVAWRPESSLELVDDFEVVANKYNL